jgi:5-methylcytosine-specific restriction protein A
VVRGLAYARSHGRCEGCGKYGLRLDVHHRQARGMGGVHSVSAEIANDIRNVLALCRTCHDETEHGETWRLTEEIGWRVPKYVADPRLVPALLHTVNGYAWWMLTEEAGYRWIDPENPPKVPEVEWWRRKPDPLLSPQLVGSPANAWASDLRMSYSVPAA